MKMKDSTDRMEFDRGNPQEEAPRRVQRRKRPELKPIWFAAVAVALLAVVLIAALTDTTAFDGLRRSVTYARAKKDETGCAQLYHYAADRTSCFASLDGSLAIVTNSQLLVMQEDGQVVCNETVKWTSCTVTGTGSLAAAYDIGGSDVYVLNAQGLVRKITCGGEILSVTLTREGRLAVTLNERGYKAAVEVYDEDGVKEFAFHSADSFLMTSSVSRDGKEMAAVTMGQSQGSFTSSIVLYKLDRQEAYATCDLAGVAVYDLGLVGKGVLRGADLLRRGGGQPAFHRPEGPGRRLLRLQRRRSAPVQPGGRRLCRRAAGPLQGGQPAAPGDGEQRRQGAGVPGPGRRCAEHVRLRPVCGGAVCRPAGDL